MIDLSLFDFLYVDRNYLEVIAIELAVEIWILSLFDFLSVDRNYLEVI